MQRAIPGWQRFQLTISLYSTGPESTASLLIHYLATLSQKKMLSGKTSLQKASKPSVRPSDVCEKRKFSKLVLPCEFIPSVLRPLHDESGHLGVDKTLELIRDWFYWPKMGAEVGQYIQNFGRCIVQKTPPHRVAPLNQITSKGPLDLVCIDFLSLEPDSQGYGNVLVVTDHYTRYAQAFPAKDQKVSTVAKILCECYFVHYGLPARIHSDQGRDFEGKLIHDLLKMFGIQKSRTTLYHPQGDPQPERFNRTLLSMLGMPDPIRKQKWSQNISQLVHAYNCTRNDSTGYSLIG